MQCSIQSCQCIFTDIRCYCHGHNHQSMMDSKQDRYIADRYNEFWHKQSLWSQETFGLDKDRGPKGPILHLKKEVQETLNSLEELQDNGRDSRTRMELVDCFFLVTDAARRSGLTYSQFMDLVDKKLEINKARKWNKPINDQPVEHDRSGE